jgi:hypothetical protein
MVSRVGGQNISDAKSTSFERLEHHLERIAFVEMDEDFQTARPEWLDASDERVSRAQPAGASLVDCVDVTQH